MNPRARNLLTHTDKLKRHYATGHPAINPTPKKKSFARKELEHNERTFAIWFFDNVEEIALSMENQEFVPLMQYAMEMGKIHFSRQEQASAYRHVDKLHKEYRGRSRKLRKLEKEYERAGMPSGIKRFFMGLWGIAMIGIGIVCIIAGISFKQSEGDSVAAIMGIGGAIFAIVVGLRALATGKGID